MADNILHTQDEASKGHTHTHQHTLYMHACDSTRAVHHHHKHRRRRRRHHHYHYHYHYRISVSCLIYQARSETSLRTRALQIHFCAAPGSVMAMWVKDRLLCSHFGFQMSRRRSILDLPLQQKVATRRVHLDHLALPWTAARCSRHCQQPAPCGAAGSCTRKGRGGVGSGVLRCQNSKD